jgi:Protein of unknown function (DUF3108)
MSRSFDQNFQSLSPIRLAGVTLAGDSGDCPHWRSLDMPGQSRFLRHGIAGVFVLLCGFGPAWLGPARAASLDISYDISLLGLTIGNASLTGDVGSERYKMEVRARLTGLATMVSGGRGAGTASGVMGTKLPPTASFAVTAANSSEQRTVRMNIEKNAVSVSEIMPPLEERPDRVPVLDEHKRGIIDPISALMMPVTNGDPRNACNRTIPIFDGAARYDISLSYAGTKQITSDGYDGPVTICAVRYTPIAGHRNRRPVKFMADNKDISVWLAPVAGAKVLLPYRISMKTMIGTLVIEASRYTIEPGATSSVKR